MIWKNFVLNIVHVIIWHNCIIKIEDFDFDNIFLDEKPWKNIFICNISCKTLIGAKPLQIMFNKVDDSIREFGGTKYLVLFGVEKYNAIDYRIRYLTGLKSGNSYNFFLNYAKSKFIHDYYNIFLEKSSYQLAKKFNVQKGFQC